MNRHQFQGRFKEFSGRVKEIVARLVHDKPWEKKGQVQKTAGKFQAGYGDFKDDLHKDR